MYMYLNTYVHMHLYAMYVGVPVESHRGGVRTAGAGVPGNCKLPQMIL